jgi:hypothetical protein
MWGESVNPAKPQLLIFRGLSRRDRRILLVAQTLKLGLLRIKGRDIDVVLCSKWPSFTVGVDFSDDKFIFCIAFACHCIFCHENTYIIHGPPGSPGSGGFKLT